MFATTLYLDIAVYLLAIFSVVYAIYTADLKRILSLFLFFVAAAALFHFEQTSMFLLSGVIIFESAAHYYGKKGDGLFIIAGMVYFFAAVQLAGAQLAAQAVLIGLLAGMRIGTSHSVSNKKVEINRDLAQMGAGAIVVACFIFFSVTAAQIITVALVLIGYVFSSLTSSGSKLHIAKVLRRLERQDAKFGRGAIWLALGVLVSISFTSNSNYIIAMLIAIFFCDSLATIIGVSFGRHKIPYNNKKSVEGFATYFVVLAVLAYPLIGVSSLPLALIAAIAESAPLHLDDNFDVPIVMLVVLLLLRT
ncbi:MAG: diacylglycerol/polyprenol kinase family protein [Candidatus Micrarchaeia archaeon]